MGIPLQGRIWPKSVIIQLVREPVWVVPWYVVLRLGKAYGKVLQIFMNFSYFFLSNPIEPMEMPWALKKCDRSNYIHFPKKRGKK